MHRTKRHSQNAIAAKARKRMAAAETLLDELAASKIFKPSRWKPDFIIRIESRFGERLQVSINRFFGRVQTSSGQSARQFCRGLEHLLTKSFLLAILATTSCSSVQTKMPPVLPAAQPLTKTAAPTSAANSPPNQIMLTWVCNYNLALWPHEETVIQESFDLIHWSNVFFGQTNLCTLDITNSPVGFFRAFNATNP